MHNHSVNSHQTLSAEASGYESFVMTTLLKLGVPAGTKGFFYIKEAVLMGIGQPIALASMSKNVYPAIAERFNIGSISRIERDIRYAVSQSSARGDKDFICRLFGCVSSYSPTNREFLSVVSEYVKQQLMGISVSA